MLLWRFTICLMCFMAATRNSRTQRCHWTFSRRRLRRPRLWCHLHEDAHCEAPCRHGTHLRSHVHTVMTQGTCHVSHSDVVSRMQSTWWVEELDCSQLNQQPARDGSDFCLSHAGIMKHLGKTGAQKGESEKRMVQLQDPYFIFMG